MRLHPTGKFDNHAAEYQHIQVRPLGAAMGAEICNLQALTASSSVTAQAACFTFAE